MRTIAVASQKGGTGKTTTVVNLAASLSERHQRCLVIDMDPQGNATTWLGCDDEGRGLLGVLGGEGVARLSDLIRSTSVAGVDLVPGGMWLAHAERFLADAPTSETRLRDALTLLDDSWGYVIVDCPPSLGFLSISALAAVREVFVAIQPHYMALRGLVQLMRTIGRLKETLNPDLEVTGVLACQVDQQTSLTKQTLLRLKERFGDLLFETTIRRNVRLAEAPSFQKPITLYAPQSPGANSYRSLAAEVLGQKNARG